jgi:hypothetical protein
MAITRDGQLLVWGCHKWISHPKREDQEKVHLVLRRFVRLLSVIAGVNVVYSVIIMHLSTLCLGFEWWFGFEEAAVRVS